MVSRDPATQRKQLTDQRRKVDFDTYDVTVDELIRRVSRSRIEIAPVYQRQFRWDDERQSKLMESLFLGIPIPPLFMATNQLAGQQIQWEVVDGLQRLLSLVNFAGDDDARNAANLLTPPLRLIGLEKLTEFSGSYFFSLPRDIQSALEDRPFKVIVLNDKSDLQVRFDLFERLNTGGVKLTAQEVRECVYRGQFMDCIVQLAESDLFKNVIRLPDSSWKDGTPEDYVLRFFAFLERYQLFDHSVKDFLNEYAKDYAKENDFQGMIDIFEKTFSYLSRAFPDGIKTRKGMTPVNLFEGITVGAALALMQNENIDVVDPTEWINSPTMKKYTTGPTNSRIRVRGRIEFCRDRFLGEPLDV